MATYGARNAMWAPWAPDFEDTDATKLPSYAKAKTFGKLNKVTDSPNFNEGSMYGDDQLSLYEKDFKDGTVDAESVFLPLGDAGEMLGAAVSEDGTALAHGDDDKPPYIGYGFHTQHIGPSGKYFQVVFYPKLSAVPTAETYETRGGSTSFVTDKMSFHWASPACRKYKIRKDFDTEDAAMAYLAGLFAGTSAVAGLPAPVAG